MIDNQHPDWERYAAVVDEHVDSFVDELRAIDIVDLISFIRLEQFPNIEDLVNSSTELFFRAEMLVFSWVAGVDLRWDERPVVTLGMEFRHPAVSLFFDLTVAAQAHQVEVLGVAFEEGEPADPIPFLHRCFREARLQDGARNPVPVSTRARRGMIGPTSDP